MYRRMAGNPMMGWPEQFAQAVLAVVGAELPAPVRVPIGPGAYEMLRGPHQATADELDAASALTALVSAVPVAESETEAA